QCAETILFQTNVEVNTIRPDIDVVAIAQVPRAERLVLVHPARQQLADVARRQAGRFLSEERLQRLLEIARRQTAQIQDRQHLGHLRRASHVRRQNRTREALSASIAVHSSVVDSRRRDLDRTRPYGHLPRLRPAVTHHEGMSAIVALITMPLEVRRYFSIESRDQHLPRALTREIIQPQGQSFGLSVRTVSDYLQHRWRILSPGRQTGRLHDWLSCGRIRRLSHPLNCRSTTSDDNSIPIEL